MEDTFIGDRGYASLTLESLKPSLPPGTMTALINVCCVKKFGIMPSKVVLVEIIA